MAIIDLTAELKNPKKNWPAKVVGGRRSVGEAFWAQFSPSTRGITEGLYAWRCFNASTIAVHDRNGPSGTTGPMKIEPSGHTLKPGTFSNGIIDRHLENHDHLHRPLSKVVTDADVVDECLEYFLLLDLTGKLNGHQLLHIEKTHWNRPIKDFLLTKGFVKTRPSGKAQQHGGAESRFLLGPHPTKAELVPVLQQLEASILAHLRLTASSCGCWKTGRRNP
jgi:hypothetical protein